VSAAPTSGPCIQLPIRALERREPVTVVEVLATGGIGGAQQHVLSLASRLDPQRFRPLVVFLSDGPALRRIERAGVPVRVLSERDDDAAIAALAAMFAELGPAVVHNHMYRAEVVGTSAALRTVAMGLPRPFIVSTVHSSRVRSAADRALVARLTPEMDRLIAVSRSIERKIAREGRRGAPVELIPNGVEIDVDLERYVAEAPSRTLDTEFGLPLGAPLVGVIARLEPEKGHPTLLDAWPLVLRESPGARLLIVGEGSRREALEEQATALGLRDTVVFTGLRDDVPAVIAELDVAVLPSYREAQGVSLLEAMVLARPIVASRVGGIPEFVEDGVTGLLVEPRDPAALAGAVVRVLRDHALADALGRKGRALVRERYCIDEMVRRVEDLYEEGIAAREALAAVQRRSA
jgi:glycosyltransferase involved in cell wall biosynthesis